MLDTARPPKAFFLPDLKECLIRVLPVAHSGWLADNGS